MLHEGLQLRQAGGGEGGDWARQVWGREVRLQAAQISALRVHGQLHPQAEAPAGEVHDEQCPRELHDLTGEENWK